MLFFGLLSVFALPSVAYFDEVNYLPIHVIAAGVFFFSTAIYAWILSSVITNNREKFSAEAQSVIDRMNLITWLMWLCLAAFLGPLAAGNMWLPRLMEWCTTFLFLNYFAFVI
mmetsp:Transcript_33763/g.24795  ORF Transcript_33763/g.24795 Transcript_33763/m.24795 type:complete len:113 (+) Transcript_33763:356-694(+)